MSKVIQRIYKIFKYIENGFLFGKILYLGLWTDWRARARAAVFSSYFFSFILNAVNYKLSAGWCVVQNTQLTANKNAYRTPNEIVDFIYYYFYDIRKTCFSILHFVHADGRQCVNATLTLHT